MSVTVDDLREVLLAATDMQLAEKLGLERSTVAQWRKRGVPQRYHFLMQMRGDLKEEARDLAVKRRLFGDGDGAYIMEASIAFIPTHVFDYPPEISIANVGNLRLELILVVARYILEVLGDERCDSLDDYINLMKKLELPEHVEGIARRIGPFLPA